MNDLFIIDAILSSLTMIARESNYSIKNRVWEFAKYLIEDLNPSRFHEIEQRALSEKIYQLSIAADIDYDFNEWRSFSNEKKEKVT